MKIFGAMTMMAALVIGTGTAQATTCTVNGETYTCEVDCTTTCNIETSVGHTACDNPFLTGNGDGFCTICGNGSGNTITGTVGADIICGKGGNDVISGDPTTGGGAADQIAGDAGNDSITGRDGNDFIDGGDDNDTLTGSAGNDTMRGGEGTDTIHGSDDDDDIAGGDDDDLLYGDRGNDAVRGDDGNDYVEGSAAPFVSSEIGDMLCGGAGDDLLVTVGHGHHCFDAGADQTGEFFETGYDCDYIAPQFPDDGDLATAVNCVAFKYDSSARHGSERSCNCQDN